MTEELGKTFREHSLTGFTVNKLTSVDAPLYSKLRSSLARQRRADYPALPKIIDDIKINGKFVVTNDNAQFLQFDTNDKNRVICFASAIQLSMLSEAKIWQADGTFWICEGHFYQVDF